MEFEKLKNPHDLFFRESMTRKKIALDILRVFLASEIIESIDFSTFEIVKDAWVDTELTEHFADILYRAKIKEIDNYIYFLFEHKSYCDKKTSLQNLRYMDQIWGLVEKQQNVKRKFPVVISVIVYHGTQPWNVSNSTRPLFEIANGLDKYVPDYQSIIINLNEINLGKIDNTESKAFFTTLKYGLISNILKVLPEIIMMFKGTKDGGDGYLSVILKYIGAVISEDKSVEFLGIIRHLSEDTSMKTVADSFREEGRIEGRNEGRTEGKDEERVVIAQKMIKKNMSNELIHELTELTFEEIETLRKK